ncbi:glycerophosphodiester phosphodiesterase [Agrobacterium sp. a22-2]|uniref:glycerophosphodiester phosphodiesterase family protein n=1 Tax=Agrobacterium sp. a22-2 TaxID=2283840 RepID=UPI00144553C7|nr:glycerophosphodiester phosphodiesterase family protein [Agrobacterium sp. a22-2]NKN36651.1 glycerophosphodiester phosphodiesterase [Agrobacterium sp. a22-2]
MKIVLGIILAVGIAIWAANTNLFVGETDGRTFEVIAHRGQHQTFDRTGLQNDTCTAQRIGPPSHSYLENTLASMRAAFDAGASVVELDVHLTPDGQFAVFHDWTLECRTDATGVTETTPMARLKELDIGYGYTADNGKTFPFRGQGIGMMPTLDEVFRALPDGRFLINFKSRREEEGTALAAMLESNPAYRSAVYGVYGDDRPTLAAIDKIEGLRGYTKDTVKDCLLTYLATGWSGYVPAACRNTLVPVPVNYAALLWGWPHRFTERMRSVGSDVLLLGPYESGDLGSAGLDDSESWALVPPGFAGAIWTNRIEQAAAMASAAGLCATSSPARLCRR